MKRLKNNSGMSLAETMVALLILIMVSVMLANGIPVAKKAYEKVGLAANAELLLSTTVAALRDELGTSSDVRVESTPFDVSVASIKWLSYYSSDIGARSRIYMAADTAVEGAPVTRGTIMLQEYIQDESLTALGIETYEGKEEEKNLGRPLVTSAASSAAEMFVRYTDLEFDSGNNTVTFSGLQVCKANDPEVVLADLVNENNPKSNLTIRTYKVEPTPEPAGGP